MLGGQGTGPRVHREAPVMSSTVLRCWPQVPTGPKSFPRLFSRKRSRLFSRHAAFSLLDWAQHPRAQINPGLY